MDLPVRVSGLQGASWPAVGTYNTLESFSNGARHCSWLKWRLHCTAAGEQNEPSNCKLQALKTTTLSTWPVPTASMVTPAMLPKSAEGKTTRVGPAALVMVTVSGVPAPFSAPSSAAVSTGSW